MDEDIGKNEMVSAFMDSTGNHDVAYACVTLEQFNWNINDAVCAALASDFKSKVIICFKNLLDDSKSFAQSKLENKTPKSSLDLFTSTSNASNEVMISKKPSHPPKKSTSSQSSVIDSPSSSYSHVPILQFEISFTLPSNQVLSENFRVPETDTIRDVKRLLVERSASQLLILITSTRNDGFQCALEECFYLDGLFTNPKKFRNFSGTLGDSTVLRNLNLPKFNNVTLVPLKEDESLDSYYESLNESIREKAETLSEHKPFANSIDHPTELHFHVSFTGSVEDSRKVLRPQLDQNISQIKKDVASLTGIIKSRQFYKLSDISCLESSTDSEIHDALCNALNQSSDNFTSLQRIGVRPGMRIFFELNPVSSSLRGNNLEESNFVEDEEDYFEYSDNDDYDPANDIPDYDRDEVNISLESDSTANNFGNPVMKSHLIDAESCTGDPKSTIETLKSRFLERYCSSETFSSNFGSRIPNFMVTSFDEAIQKTFGHSSASCRKPLLVYLHNDRSIACHLFCQLILTHEAFKRFLDYQNTSIWPWDVTLPCARDRLRGWFTARLNQRVTEHVFRISDNSFPLILVIGKLNRQVEILAQIEGTGKIVSWPLFGPHRMDDFDFDNFPPLITEGSNLPIMQEHDEVSLSADAVSAKLVEIFMNYQDSLQPDIDAERERLERERVLCEQQEAYNESLRQDRLKMEEKNRMEREQMEKLRAEQQAKEDADRKAAQMREQKAALVPEQPPDPKTDEGKEYLKNHTQTRGIATLRFRLPNAAKPTEVRRFLGTHSLDQLYNFVESLGFTRDLYKLLTTYPRRDLSNENVTKLLADLGLVPEETLIIEER